jgi:hypothetical protein
MKLGFKYTDSQIALLIDNWDKIANENGGKRKAFYTSCDNTYLKFELAIPCSGSIIQFATDEFKPLKIKYIFNKSFDFEFLIYPEDFTDKVSKFFGFKEIEIGDPIFDDKFFIRSNHKELLIKLLTTDIKTFLTENFISNFKLEKNENTSVLELNLVINELDYLEMNNTLNFIKNIIETIELLSA